MSKELDRKRCGANVEKVIIDEFVPSKELEALEIIDKKNLKIFSLKKSIKLYGKDIESALKDYNNCCCQLQTIFLTLEEIVLLKEMLKYYE
jgi:hypothetical protein